MSDGRTGVVIGDAAGHGLNSALNIAEVRAYVRALAATESRLERIFSLTNQHFIHDAEEVSFVTLLLVQLNPITGELNYNNAGHLSGCVFDAMGRLRRTMPSTSFPLGIISGARFPPGPALRLDPGDWVLMFTDGVIDARSEDGELLGIDGFLKFAREVYPGRSARESMRILLDRVANFADGQFDDDMTAVVIARNAG
jgi:serine phosphatase RsbU (regulator of sigma subunit)